MTDSPIEMKGSIVDSAGRPVAAATVRWLVGKESHATTVADSSGRFSLPAISAPPGGGTLEVRALGYELSRITLDTVLLKPDEIRLDIVLSSSPVVLPSIKVRPQPDPDLNRVQLDRSTLNRKSRRSLVPTNPVGAIRNAQVARAGSAHSSKLRIYGTSPDYFLNGLPIGQDPDHYGIFTVIPTSVVEKLDAELLGTPARHRSPSVVQFTTPKPFESHRRLLGLVSTIEATATGSVGSERIFVMGSVRKSVLDKLVDRIKVSSDRRTLPPTNFQDITIHGGWRINSGLTASLDHYAVRDYLVYGVESQVSDGQNSTFQHTTRHFTSLRVQAEMNRAVVTAAVGWRAGTERYEAEPELAPEGSGVHLDLKEHRRSLISSTDMVASVGAWLLSGGVDWTLQFSRETELKHQNWNFLSPLANSDRPFVYQSVLNESWSDYRDNDRRILNGGVYVNSQRNFGDLSIEAGLRGEYFSELAVKRALVWRAEAVYAFSDKTRVRVFAGSFATSPVGNLLEDYQVLIRDQANLLSPITTQLYSAALRYGDARLVVFHKRLGRLPSVKPVFSDPEALTPPDLAVHSEGKTMFSGGSLGWERTGWPLRPLDITASYALTSARQTDLGVTTPHDLTARHRLFSGISWRVSENFTLGSELDARTGYNYTPAQPTAQSFQEQTFSQEVYAEELAHRNEDVFPAHVSLNLNFEYRLGRGVLFGAVSNVTNRANPIINTAGGFIHDAGILPTIGYRFSF